MDRLLCWRGGDGTGTTGGTVLINRRAAFAAGKCAFNTVLDSGQDGGDRQVPGGTDHQQRDHLLRAVVDHLDGIKQLRHRQDVHHRRALGEADDFIESRRQNGTQRLRQNDAHRAAPGRQTERGGGLILPVIDPEETTANDLGGIGALHQR